MRARVYSNGGNSTGGFTFNGGQLTGALILAGNPSELLEAASKQYVDSSLVNLSASHLTTGTLPSARLPSFAGDIVKPAGSSTINLAPNGIVAGDYVKPTVDSKGRVTGGGTLVSDDITNLSWDKITTGKPTTLAGYGITDGISLSGGTLTGFLTFNGSVTGNMQAATKQYIDSTLSSSSGIAIGDIIRKPYATTPNGFLKCNGAEVSKTTYSSLYSVIGDRFSKNMVYHGGQPWKLQYNINDSQVKDINSWNTATALPSNLSLSQAIVTKNRVYLCGGYNGTSALSTVYTAQINSDGTLGTWTTSGNFPIPIFSHTCVIIKNKVYLLGGTNGSNILNTIYTATINSDGTLDSWILYGSLPIAVHNTQFLLTKNRIYLLGGHGVSGIFSNIYSSYISTDGSLSSWFSDGNLPTTLGYHNLAIIKNRVYLLGGFDGSIFKSTVYTTTINTDGTIGSWILGVSLPQALDLGGLYITRKSIYIIGFNINGVTSSTVYTAQINADGTLGTWTIGTNIPGNLGHSQVIATKNRIYLLGGHASAPTSVVYTSPISGGLNDYSSYYAEDTTNYMMPGSGKPWEQQYQINSLQSTDITSWITTTSLPSILAASQAIVTKNRVYLCGGHTSNNTFTSTVYTAPINADGTLGTWTTGTSLPGDLTNSQIVVTKNRVYLLGGLNGSSYISTVYTAPINSDGTLGTWLIGTSLPTNLGHSQAIVTKNRVYLLGGGGGSDGISPVSTIYTAPINSDGTLGTWSSSGSIPQTKWAAKAFITKNRVYLCGGWNGVSLNTVHSATINSDGLIGIWKTEANLPVALVNSAIVVFNKKVFILGSGTVSTGSAISTVYVADIFPDGTLGSWTTSVSLPDVTCYTTPIITKNHIYLCGRSNGQTAFSSVYMANILGGENDYSPYYDGTVTPIIPVDHSTVFTLPDLINNEKFDTVSYIKY